MKDSSQNSGIVNIAAIAVAAAALFVHTQLTVPVYEAAQVLRGVHAAYAKAAGDPRVLEARLPALLAEYERTPQIQELISRAMPKDDGAASFFQYLQALSAENNLPLHAFSAEKNSLQGRLGVVAVDASLEGDYDNFVVLIDALENALRLNRVTGFTIDKNGAISLQLETYYTHWDP